MEDTNKDIEILENLLEEGFEAMCYPEAQAIKHLIKAYKEKDKDNNDLRRLYRRTAIKLKENEKEKLADYFLAQINEVPTFVVDDDIDYYEEYYKLRAMNKSLEKENKTLKNVVSEIFNSEDVIDKYIPVSLVEEKIEELKEDIKKGKTRYPYILEHKIEVLQELLERRK